MPWTEEKLKNLVKSAHIEDNDILHYTFAAGKLAITVREFEFEIVCEGIVMGEEIAAAFLDFGDGIEWSRR